MKHINVSRPLASGIPASTFESAKALACSVAESDPELLGAGVDRSAG